MKINTKICPVCKSKHWEIGFRQHIVQKARAELWHFHNKEISIMPHVDYFDKNSVEIKVKKIRRLK